MDGIFWGSSILIQMKLTRKKGRFSVLVQDSPACYVEWFQVFAYILGRICPKSIFVHIKGPTKTKEKNSRPSFVPPKISNPHIQLIRKKPTNKTQSSSSPPPCLQQKELGGERELLGFYHGFLRKEASSTGTTTPSTNHQGANTMTIHEF